MSCLNVDPGEYGVLLGENTGNGFIFHPRNEEINTFY